MAKKHRELQGERERGRGREEKQKLHHEKWGTSVMTVKEVTFEVFE